MNPSTETIRRNYEIAKEAYAGLGVDTEKAMAILDELQVSLHCWQGDDVGGFENPEGSLSGGIQATGNYPGKATTPAELRADIEKVMSLLPGKQRLNIHALYIDYPEKIERNVMKPAHFQSWIDWAKKNGIGLDFNSSFFSHPKSEDGYTLASADEETRQFWIDHLIASRQIAAEIGKQLNSPCCHNIWIPDGEKDQPADRWSPRARLMDSLDKALAVDVDKNYCKDFVESKLFGIGAESYTVGSQEFYLAYAISRGVGLTMDMGHYHPTEVVSDKISAVLTYMDEVLLHVSRGVRWDSDHVVTLSDELLALCQEVVRGDAMKRVHFGLDFFDASINRIAAWVIGTRAMQKAMLIALLEPSCCLKKMESVGDKAGRLALMEDLKNMPWGLVWDFYCVKNGVPAGNAWMDDVRAYEKSVVDNR